MKTTTGTSRRPWQGNARARDIRLREERVARLLDDPEKLRELRQQRAERKAEKQQQSKGRLLEHANLSWPGLATGSP